MRLRAGGGGGGGGARRGGGPEWAAGPKTEGGVAPQGVPSPGPWRPDGVRGVRFECEYRGAGLR